MGRSLEIREAAGGDPGPAAALSAADELGRERERPGKRPDDAHLEAFSQIGDDERNCLIVAEEGARVAASHRGEAVGGFLFEWLVALASERGRRMGQPTIGKWRPDALRFYEAHGFEATCEGIKLQLAH